MVQQYITVAANLESFRKAKADWGTKADAIGEFIFRIQELDAFTEFDKKLWRTVIDTVIVHDARKMTVKFQGVTEIDT